MSFLRLIPSQVWFVLGGAILLGLGVWWHHSQAKNHYETAFRAGVKHEGDRITDRVNEITAELQKHTAKLRKIRNVQRVTIFERADAARLRGPGNAACTSVATAPSLQPGRSPAEGSAPVAVVPSGEGQQLIGLPFSGAVALARNHDLIRADLQACYGYVSAITEISQNPN